MARPICEIAREIKNKWKRVSDYAKPYLDAMLVLETVDDNYCYDSGDSIVRYFLTNATGWRGEKAKEIKAELKAML